MILPILAAVSRATEIIVDKEVLSRQKLHFKTYLLGGFTFVLLIATVIGLTWGKISPSFFQLPYLLAFIGIVGTAVGWNSIFYRAIQKEKLSDAEPFILATPLMVILISAIFIPEERKWGYIILAIIASLSVIISRFHRKNFHFNIYSLALVGYAILFAFEALFIKVILNVCNPFALYPLRVLFVMTILAFIFKSSFKGLNHKNWISLFAVGFIANAYHLLLYFSYDRYGVSVTALFTVLEPILVYIASLFLFKEKFNWRNVIAAAIVLACVIYAQFL
jgi:drug/metabolite transporter (DMT)-like permease